MLVPRRIFGESVSGGDNNRKQLNEMLSSTREGDVVVVYKIDRIAKSLRSLIEIVEQLSIKKVDLVSLDSGDRFDTISPMGKAFFQIAGVFAELERGMINTRTQAGIERTKSLGIKFGRTSGQLNKNIPNKHDRIRIFLKAGKSYDWITKELSVSKKTISDLQKTL